ncbi:MAG: [protein-PII] uridylyltransferase [Mycobacterium sp.]|nr:MAG: [protein-PII] uridylyltransferase [Mycobacterium sp.]
MTRRMDDPAAGRASRPAAGPPHAATDLAAASRQLLEGGYRRLDSAGLREALVDLHELWLTAKSTELGITADSGFALVATGGLGRRELVPFSDLDLMLVHDGMPADLVGETAEQLWYPLWDANIRLDHSVRTVPEALSVADSDVAAGLAMLEVRHIAGNEQLSATLIDGARQQWRAGITKRFEDLVAATRARWQRSGQIAHRAEPDLKCGMGGLRDVQLLRALAVAQVADVYPVLAPDSQAGSLSGAYLALLNVRTELHRVSRRGRDQLLAQFADEVGAALRIGDRFDLARVISDAARTVSYYVDAGLRTAANALPRRGLAKLRRPIRRPLDEGVIEYAGEIILARDARPQRDSGLVLRVAAASAATGIPIAASTLGRLADTAPELRAPWPRDAVDDLLVLLTAGPTTVTTIEALDRTGLWGRLFPEWGAIRDLPPRDPVHTWTVDRHLVETVSRASAFTTRVSRPDLLVLGALLHDIGKGRGGDHSQIGAELAVQVGNRLGLWPSDVRVLAAMVRHHLLLPSTATRRDLADPATISEVVDTLGGDSVLLELLQVLSEADSLATGPGVWGDWKAALIGDLVRRCRALIGGEDHIEPEPIAPEDLSLASDGEVHVVLKPGDIPHTYQVTMTAPDRRGLLSRAAGVLALHSLGVHSATVNSAVVSGRRIAINTFVVSPQFGTPSAAEVLRQQFKLALDGELDVFAALEKRGRDAAAHGPRRAGEPEPAVPAAAAAPPVILWHDGAVPGGAAVEIRSGDRTGLLAMLTRVFERAGIDIAWARITTLGSSVVDVFAITDPGVAGRQSLEDDLYSVLPAPPPGTPVQEAG